MIMDIVPTSIPTAMERRCAYVLTPIVPAMTPDERRRIESTLRWLGLGPPPAVPVPNPPALHVRSVCLAGAT